MTSPGYSKDNNGKYRRHPERAITVSQKDGLSSLERAEVNDILAALKGGKSG